MMWITVNRGCDEAPSKESTGWTNWRRRSAISARAAGAADHHPAYRENAVAPATKLTYRRAPAMSEGGPVGVDWIGSTPRTLRYMLNR